MSGEETSFLYLAPKLVVAVDIASNGSSEIERLLVYIILYLVEQRDYILFDAVERHSLFLELIATRYLYRAVFQIASAESQTHGDTFEFVLGKFPPRLFIVGVVELDTHSKRPQLVYDGAYTVCNGSKLFGILINRHYHYLYRSQTWRQHKPVIVRMCHYQSSHKACRDTPRRRPNIFEFVVFVDELHVERLGEVLTQEVRRTRLQCLAVLHHRLDTECLQSPCKTLVCRLYTFYHGQSHITLRKIGIHVQHLGSFLHSLFTRGVSGVSLLPEELGSAEE